MVLDPFSLWAGCSVTIVLGVYLAYALIRPERF